MTKRLFRAVSSQIIRVNFARLYQTLALNPLSVNASVSDTQLALTQFMSHTESFKYVPLCWAVTRGETHLTLLTTWCRRGQSRKSVIV